MPKYIFLCLKKGADEPERNTHVVDLSQYELADDIPFKGEVEEATLIFNERNTQPLRVGDLAFNLGTGAWWRLSPRGFLRTFPIGEMPKARQEQYTLGF